jgi:glycosyltransferase involved in cell wall biosynthesis
MNQFGDHIIAPNIGRIGGGARLRGIKTQSSSPKPLVSLITVVYNGFRHIEQAIQSVISQTYKNIEYLIIDGGSTDGTLEIIKQYDDAIDYWVSEKDTGIYNAMNKGICLCHGEIIGLLNSDDFYFQTSIEEVVRSYNVFGEGIYYGKQMNFIEYEDYCYFTIASPELAKMFEKPSIFHPACFVHKEVYKRVGLFDETYKVISDYDFLLKALEEEVPFFQIEPVLTGFRSGGASGSVRIWSESYRLIRQHPRCLCSQSQITTKLLTVLLKRWIAKIVNYDRNLYLRRKKLYFKS